MDTRGSGILLPVFSISGKYGIGSFSDEARDFIDFLSTAGQKYWQILPLGPTSYGDSPYQSFSTFAMNPYFIDIDTLVKEGLLSKEEADELIPHNDSEGIEYEWLYHTRINGLKKAFARFNRQTEDYILFCTENEDWLSDYALFMAIKRLYADVSFDNWPVEIKSRNRDIISKYRIELSEETEFYKFIQYVANSQWKSLKAYANGKGIKIIGDIPIYVAYDSSDVWTNPRLFQMDEEGKPSAVAGCPPDGFSADGQLWGNPLYDWEYHKSTGYKWWLRRIEKCNELYDIIRIDHFRGFDEYYSVPFGDTNARNGKWCKGPGIELFNAIRAGLGDIEIIAEDLGYITDSVKKLVTDTGFPNMKVLEFAFDSRDSSGPSLYLPHNYDKNCVVYTGTHDNETIRGWLEDILPEELMMVKKYVNRTNGSYDEITDELIRLAHASTAKICIIPMQDYLHLGNEARINKPSTLGGNWMFRLKSRVFDQGLAYSIRQLSETYGRL